MEKERCALSEEWVRIAQEMLPKGPVKVTTVKPYANANEQSQFSSLFPPRLVSAFPDLYAVGGCVRDCLLSVTPKDIDFATPLLPEEVIGRAEAHGLHVIPTGIKHGTVTVISDGMHYEITTFRKDVSCDGRNATVAFSRSLEDDLVRRDFTINAMAVNTNHFLIAASAWRKDFDDRIIRCVGNPQERFREDYLRIIRMARFAARLDFTIEWETLLAARLLAPEVMKHVSPERIFQEFSKAFDSNNAGRFLRILTEIGLLTHIFPEFEGFETMEQDPVHHPEGPVSEHVFISTERCDPKYRWNAFLHDVGKPKVFKETGIYREHDKVGTEMIEEIAKRLHFPNELRDSVRETTKYHMYPPMMRGKSRTIPNRLKRRFQSKTRHCLEALKAVVAADKGERFFEVEGFFDELPTKVEPIVLGRHLLERGVKPGPEMGKLLKEAYDYQIEEGEEDLEKIINHVLLYKL